jgi:hypothetical protein
MAKREKITDTERAEWVTDLRDILDRATKDRDGNPIVWQFVTHVTRSGMSRSIRSVAIVDGEPYVLDYRISRILDWSTDQRNGGVKVSGVGMDMGFHLVYSLSRALYGKPTGDAECINGRKVDVGYRLKQRWL